jgi:hypothetical protein
MQKLRKLFDNVIYESVIKPIILNEIDWDSDFKDVKQSCINPVEVVDYLNRVRANAPKKTKDREKFGAKYPFVHSKSSFFKDTEGGIDIEHFIGKMTTPPNNVINTNEKILKSGGPNEYVYKTGIPAFRGIVYDISKGKFHYINTCPGAGDCVLICYALKGRYIQYPVSYDSMTRRLNYMLNYPDKYEEQLYNELKAKAKEHSAFEGYKARVILRWNDSGDFFGKRYNQMAEDVMEKLKSEGYNVDSYAYTKSADVAQNSKLDTTFSQGANRKQSQQMANKDHKESVVVPKELFKDLNFMKVSDEQELKNRVSKFFNIPKNLVITYDELKSTPKGDEQKWAVIVTPNDGDDAAFRPDVKKILLTQH